MNEYGGKETPFLFVLDYELQKCLVYPFQDIPTSVKFKVGNYSNYTSVASEPFLGSFTFNTNPISFETYHEIFNQVKEEIFLGNSFLLNLTCRTPISTNLTLSEIFEHSNTPYKLLLDDHCSVFSPECFVKIDNGIISTFPMKGTIVENDNAEMRLRNSEKEYAEHVTVVDLLRNDLSMFSKNVHVPRLMYVDRLETHSQTLLQMTSEISGTLQDDYKKHLGDIIFSMLPAGSISGAPKYKTLEIIRRVENLPRGYYTGVFGYFDGHNVDSAVMIRFIEQNEEGKLYFRSGCGITSLSNAEEEYQEMINKVYLPFTREMMHLHT